MQKRIDHITVDLGEAQGFKPMGNLVAIQLTEKSDTTSAGVIYTEKENAVFGDGTVLSIGAGSPNDNGRIYPVDFKEGDRVLFDKTQGCSVVNGIVLTERENIVAVVDKDAEIK
tara:strand:- start:669 stop:1010 length:342 start_codon:yes stop_codon:yes gene_type:complete